MGRSVSSDSNDSAIRLLTLRRPAFCCPAIPHLLVAESPFPRTRSQVLVDEYRHSRAPLATPIRTVHSTLSERCAPTDPLHSERCAPLFPKAQRGEGALAPDRRGQGPLHPTVGDVRWGRGPLHPVAGALSRVDSMIAKELVPRESRQPGATRAGAGL